MYMEFTTTQDFTLTLDIRIVCCSCLRISLMKKKPKKTNKQNDKDTLSVNRLTKIHSLVIE